MTYAISFPKVEYRGFSIEIFPDGFTYIHKGDHLEGAIITEWTRKGYDKHTFVSARKWIREHCK